MLINVSSERRKYDDTVPLVEEEVMREIENTSKISLYILVKSIIITNIWSEAVITPPNLELESK